MVTRPCPLSRRHDVKGGELLHAVQAVVFEAAVEGEADQRAASPEVATERRRAALLDPGDQEVKLRPFSEAKTCRPLCELSG